MIRVLGMVNALLSAHERKRAIQVFALMLAMALMEAIGVASIMPFIAALSKTEVIYTNKYLAFLYNILGFTDRQAFLLLLGTLTLVVYLTALTFKALTSYVLVRFTTMRLHSISMRLLTAYLRQPYSFFLGRNTADLGKSVLSEVSKVTNGVIQPILKAMSGAIVTLSILILLLFIEPLLSFVAALVLGGAFTSVYLITRHLLHRIGRDRVKANQARYIVANEALNGIKELRLLGRVDSYLKKFRGPSERFVRHQATSAFISDLPQFGIQGIAFGGALVAVLYLTVQRGGINEALPLISLYAFAGYRLMPAFQLVFSNLTRIRFSMPVLELLYQDLQYKESHVIPIIDLQQETGEGLNRPVQMVDVSFCYPNSDRYSVSDLSLTIPHGSSVAFVGSTGAGKSTVVDLILGLLEPTTGQVLVNDKPLQGSNLIHWQKNIGYVPQSTYLADDTVAANIAFGVPEQKIDYEAVQRAARIAHIHEFVEKELPNGYHTVVGERGIRLSGGQRQRLAIARALYHDPNVVVFDEATSALDSVTEAFVMKVIDALHGHKTIIIIAHRISTVQQCDQIFVMNNGRLVGEGSYIDLLDTNPLFMELVQAKSK